AAEDADSAANQGGLIAAYVVVETQAWRPQDVAAREGTRVDVQDGRVERRVERRLVHRGNVRSQARGDRQSGSRCKLILCVEPELTDVEVGIRALRPQRDRPFVTVRSSGPQRGGIGEAPDTHRSGEKH